MKTNYEEGEGITPHVRPRRRRGSVPAVVLRKPVKSVGSKPRPRASEKTSTPSKAKGGVQ